MAYVGPEAQWAFGFGTLPENATPPEWVRRTIRCFYGHPPVAPKTLPKLTPEQLIHALGLAKGMAAGARVWTTQPLDNSGIRPEHVPKVDEIKSKISAILQPQAQKIDETLSKIPPEVFEKTFGTLAAYSKGQSEAVEFYASAEESSASEELLWFLWMLWPEVQPANSVRELHRWIEHLGLVTCSLKLVEKVCGKIGFRPSSRGRKKRIPTESA